LSKPRVGLILGSAVFAYFVTVIERSSMGVASLAATERFHVGAATLSSLAVSQLAVYAAMQIPVGLLLDRFGAKRLIILGSLITGIGNSVVAFSPHISMAVAGRMLVGFGDAFVFVSMIRLVNGWAPGGRATRFTQLFANIGQLGQIASAIPFAYLLGFAGWSVAFSVVASLALVSAAVGTIFLREEPGARSGATEVSWKKLLRKNLKDANTRKAFWVHFTLQSSGSMFILLWGYPFLVQGEGLPKSTASTLLSSFVFIGFLIGPVLSRLCIKYPARRHLLVLTMYSLMIAAWLLILLTPGQNPLWQIALLVLCIGSGGPASMMAFDYSRTSIPKDRLGSANGVINSGGFVATFSSMLLVGLALDFIHANKIFGEAQLYSLPAFKAAFLLLLAVVTFGLVMFYRERAITQQNIAAVRE
jgi:MFS family permease